MTFTQLKTRVADLQSSIQLNSSKLSTLVAHQQETANELSSIRSIMERLEKHLSHLNQALPNGDTVSKEVIVDGFSPNSAQNSVSGGSTVKDNLINAMELSGSHIHDKPQEVMVPSYVSGFYFFSKFAPGISNFEHEGDSCFCWEPGLIDSCREVIIDYSDDVESGNKAVLVYTSLSESAISLVSNCFQLQEWVQFKEWPPPGSYHYTKGMNVSAQYKTSITALNFSEFNQVVNHIPLQVIRVLKIQDNMKDPIVICYTTCRKSAYWSFTMQNAGVLQCCFKGGTVIVESVLTLLNTCKCFVIHYPGIVYHSWLWKVVMMVVNLVVTEEETETKVVTDNTHQFSSLLAFKLLRICVRKTKAPFGRETSKIIRPDKSVSCHTTAVVLQPSLFSHDLSSSNTSTYDDLYMFTGGDHRCIVQWCFKGGAVQICLGISTIFLCISSVLERSFSLVKTYYSSRMVTYSSMLPSYVFMEGLFACMSFFLRQSLWSQHNTQAAANLDMDYISMVQGDFNNGRSHMYSAHGISYKDHFFWLDQTVTRVEISWYIMSSTTVGDLSSYTADSMLLQFTYRLILTVHVCSWIILAGVVLCRAGEPIQEISNNQFLHISLSFVGLLWIVYLSSIARDVMLIMILDHYIRLPYVSDICHNSSPWQCFWCYELSAFQEIHFIVNGCTHRYFWGELGKTIVPQLLILHDKTNTPSQVNRAPTLFETRVGVSHNLIFLWLITWIMAFVTSSYCAHLHSDCADMPDYRAATLSEVFASLTVIKVYLSIVGEFTAASEFPTVVSWFEKDEHIEESTQSSTYEVIEVLLGPYFWAWLLLTMDYNIFLVKAKQYLRDALRKNTLEVAPYNIWEYILCCRQLFPSKLSCGCLNFQEEVCRALFNAMFMVHINSECISMFITIVGNGIFQRWEAVSTSSLPCDFVTYPVTRRGDKVWQIVWDADGCYLTRHIPPAQSRGWLKKGGCHEISAGYIVYDEVGPFVIFSTLGCIVQPILPLRMKLGHTQTALSEADITTVRSCFCPDAATYLTACSHSVTLTMGVEETVEGVEETVTTKLMQCIWYYDSGLMGLSAVGYDSFSWKYYIVSSQAEREKSLLMVTHLLNFLWRIAWFWVLVHGILDGILELSL